MRSSLRGIVQGILLGFGSGNTPVTQGFWKRFDPETGEELPGSFLPLAGIPTTLAQQRPREASPTGKSGMGIANYSVVPQNVASKRTILYDTQPIYRGEGKLITQAVITPQATKSVPQPSLLGPKFK